jgi:hypothetical protein
MQEQIDVLAKQVSGNSSVELSSDNHSNTEGEKGRHEGKTDKETSSLAADQQPSIKKTTGSIVFKLLFSPIYILRYTLQNILNLRAKDGSDIEIKSGSTGGVTHIKDSTETVPGNGKNAEGNGNDKENVLAGTASHDSVIPMGSGKAKEHDSRFEGF